MPTHSGNHSPTMLRDLDRDATWLFRHADTTGMPQPWDIVVDVDGVLYDFVDAFAQEARLQGVGDVPTDPRPMRWEFFRDWGLTAEQFSTLFSAGVKDGRIFWQGSTYSCSHRGWSSLRTQGHRIHIVTDRSPRGAEDEAHEATLSWLESQNFIADTVTIASDKGDAIASLVRNTSTCLFIDDRPENVHAAASVGVRGVLMDQPWNRSSRLPRVRSLTQFAALVADESRGAQLLPSASDDRYRWTPLVGVESGVSRG